MSSEKNVTNKVQRFEQIEAAILAAKVKLSTFLSDRNKTWRDARKRQLIVLGSLLAKHRPDDIPGLLEKLEREQDRAAFADGLKLEASPPPLMTPAMVSKAEKAAVRATAKKAKEAKLAAATAGGELKSATSDGATAPGANSNFQTTDPELDPAAPAAVTRVVPNNSAA